MLIAKSIQQYPISEASNSSLQTHIGQTTNSNHVKMFRVVFILIFAKNCRLLSEESQLVNRLASLPLCQIAVCLCLDRRIQLLDERLPYRLSELESEARVTLVSLSAKR